MTGHLTDIARSRRKEAARSGAIIQTEALAILRNAVGGGYIKEWELRVGQKDNALCYSVLVVFKKRLADGSIGRRRGETWYSDNHPHPDTAIVRAAMKVANQIPEMPL
jgi:hypothetical protein